MILKKMIHRLEKAHVLVKQPQDPDLKFRYDAMLLDSLRRTRSAWLEARRFQQSGLGDDDDAWIRTSLAKQKYLYLYRVARERHVQNRFRLSMFRD